ncbi:thymidylate synthase [Mastigocoleus testarum BC008]|uniref:FAD-dependent thymidylate synthase n=1 Tax=Mastigocoleus testarum BC008 TaxID=371196 RepID=A0A0V7ZVJ2_9CYAN|nr:thymidylate synthase [Mastigocoleus testarum BC008]
MHRFRVEVITKTPNPQQVVYAAMHQDYTDNFVFDELDRFPSESKCGELIVKRLLAGERGHYGPLEHPQIVFNCGYFPHSVMQQARTHRVGVSFDVQCLAADTKITFVNIQGETNQKLKKTIGELYDLWTNGEKAIRQRSIRGRNGEPRGEYRRDCKNRISKMRLRVLNEETGLFTTGSIKDVMCSGIQPTYRLTLENGKTLECTVNHRLLTTKGWQTMGDAVGLVTDSSGRVIKTTKPISLMCNGQPVVEEKLYRNKEWLQSQVIKGLSTIEIAQLSECSINTVKRWADRYGLSLNKQDSKFTKGQKPWNYNPNAPYHNKAWLEKQLNKGLHVDEIADLADCSIEAIKKWVYAYGLFLNRRLPGTKTPWNKGKSGYKLNLSKESRKRRIENSKKYTKRGEESNFWRGGTSTEREMIGAWTREIAPQVHKKFNYICQKCQNRGGILHAHHLIPVFADESYAYSFDNLVTLCKKCHEYIHKNHKEIEFAQAYEPTLEVKDWQTKPKPIGKKLKAHPVKVLKVEYLGEQMTYDLEVEGEWHNFVANGLVVHNSFRYTGNQFIEVIEGKKDIEDVFYLRPVDHYTNRQGKKYYYSPEAREADLKWCMEAVKRYQADFEGGMSEEHARGKMPFDYRQHFVVSFNLRSLLHFLDLRNKKDAQLEIQKLCELMWIHFEEWAPAIAQWYEKHRSGKARLAP